MEAGARASIRASRVTQNTLPGFDASPPRVQAGAALSVCSEDDRSGAPFTPLLGHTAVHVPTDPARIPRLTSPLTTLLPGIGCLHGHRPHTGLPRGLCPALCQWALPTPTTLSPRISGPWHKRHLSEQPVTSPGSERRPPRPVAPPPASMAPRPRPPLLAPCPVPPPRGVCPPRCQLLTPRLTWPGPWRVFAAE